MLAHPLPEKFGHGHLENWLVEVPGDEASFWSIHFRKKFWDNCLKTILFVSAICARVAGSASTFESKHERSHI